MTVDAERLLRILDSLDYHIALYDREWRYTYVNAEAARVLGRAVQDLIGECIWDLFPEAVGNQYYVELHEAASSGRAVHSDHFYTPFKRWFENHIYPLPDGVMVLARDVTDQRSTSEALFHREEMLRLAQRAGGIATFEWDFRNQVALCSREFFAIFGLPDRDGVMLGTEWAAFVHPADRDRMAQHLTRALQGLEPASADYRINAADGTLRWLSYQGQLLSTGDGDRMLGTVIDITARKQSEIALESAKTAAEAANQLKDEFLATLSHELRTPLNAILGYARMLRTDSIAPEKRERALAIIERNAIAQKQLIEDLLDMSRITTGRIRLEPRQMSVLALLRESVEGVRPAADAKGLVLELELDPSADLVVGDEARLQQVFWNLLNNAVKFTATAGRVVVRARRQASDVEITVTDSGVGISPEFIPFVFDPFRQADGGVGREHGGLGLGLAISRQIVQLHGGTIVAESDGAGCGASFTVRLPQYAAEAREPESRMDNAPADADLARPPVASRPPPNAVEGV